MLDKAVIILACVGLLGAACSGCGHKTSAAGVRTLPAQAISRTPSVGVRFNEPHFTPAQWAAFTARANASIAAQKTRMPQATPTGQQIRPGN